MPPKNPLEIPEIVDLIAAYLESGAIATCLLVSKVWHDSFLPHRWRVIRAGHGSRNQWSNQRGPHPVDVYRHRHLIQDLSLLGDLSGLDKYQYPNLHKLRIDLSSTSIIPDHWISLDFTETCPSMVVLNFDSVNLTSESWRSLSAHEHIKKLHLTRVEIHAPEASLFWKTCEGLESLTLNEVTFEHADIPPDLLFHRLHKVVMWRIEGLDDAAQLDLILRSPKLADVDWASDGSRSAIHPTILSRPIGNRHWPHLNKLFIDCELRDSELASILDGVGDGSGNMVQLWLIRCLLGRQASRALGVHFGTLVKLNLTGCVSASSSIFRDILCSCDQLEELLARNVFAKDVVESGPWVCRRLQRLKICFRFKASEQDLQKLIFQRLATLLHLETLIMHLPLRDECNDEVLEFRLDCGLEELVTLQRLTILSFDIFSDRGSYYPQLGKDEVDWIVNNLNLERIRGDLNRDRFLNEQLKAAIEFHEIAI
ncbi:hypothetical protein BGX31_003380 [Mortierella sp. GBA43]|nr:hypothetical protein BGX31_003380 [Mortierella sp. GBA43]